MKATIPTMVSMTALKTTPTIKLKTILETIPTMVMITVVKATVETNLTTVMRRCLAQLNQRMIPLTWVNFGSMFSDVKQDKTSLKLMI